MSVNMNPSGVLVSGDTQGFEPVLKHRFQVRLEDCRAGVGSLDQVDMDYACQTFDPGSKTVEAGTYTLQNQQIRYPLRKGAHQSISMGLVIFGGKNNLAYDFFWRWFQKVHDDGTDQIGVVGPDATEDVSGDFAVDLLNPDGSVARTCKCLYCWPTSFKVMDLDRKSDAEAIIATVTFEINQWTWVTS